MKLFKFILPCFLVCSVFTEQKVIVDQYFSPYCGSANLLFAQNLLVLGEDYFFDGTDRNSTSKTFWRVGEQIIFWYNINMLSAVTQHEVFGHGYRLREFGLKAKKYWISPWGGTTYFETNDSFSVGKMLAITVGGLEAEAILAKDLKMQWLQQKQIDGRLSQLYTQTAQSLFWYTLITQLGKLKNEKLEEGNDIDNYIKLLNASYLDKGMNIGKLTRWSLFNWLDPMTFYAFFAWFYYMAEGKSWPFPMIGLNKDNYYLPNIRFGYAPYAPEAYLENFFLLKEDLFYCYVKRGSRSFGLGGSYNHTLSGRIKKIGVNLDLWNHNLFLSDATLEDLQEEETAFRPILNKRKWGVALSLTSYFKLFSKTSLFAEVGAKTSGYLPGNSLDKSFIGRIGTAFDF